MAQENNILYTIKEKDFKKYAKRWFKKELQNTVKQIDNCLAKVQELKMAKDAYPQKVLLPMCDIISQYKFELGRYKDFIERDFLRETQQYTKNNDYCDQDNDESYYKTRIIYSDQPGDYDDWPSADFIVSEEYDDFVASVVTYALNAALAKSDLLSAAVFSVYTERINFMYDDDPSDENSYHHAKDTVDTLLDKTPLFPGAYYNKTNLKAKNKKKVDKLISKLRQMILVDKLLRNS